MIRKILIDIKALLNLKGWTQGALAKNSSGIEVDMHSTEAICFCIVGATAAVVSDYTTNRKVRNHIRQFTPGNLIFDWNDAPGRTLQEVNDLLDKAINSLPGEQQ